MRRFAYSTFISLAMCLGAGAATAQDGDGEGVGENAVEAEETPEPRLFSFDTAGFEFDATAAYEPVVRETSNAEYYTVTFQRRIAGGFAEGTDGQMPFMRLTRTIDPLGEEKNLRAVLEDTIRGAVSSMDDTFGLRRDRKFTETTLRILGEEREGMRVDIAVLGDGSQLYAECYAFEDRHGHGVGVMMKLTERVDGELPVDQMLSEEILGSLEVRDLPADGWYGYELGRTTLRVPVRSKLDRVRRVNEYVVEANFALERGTLRVQVIRPPGDVNLEAVSQQQLVGYARALRQQQQRGELDLAWAADSYLPVRGETDVLVKGLSFGLDAGGVSYYNSMYAPVVNGEVVVASFSGSTVFTEDLVGYASGFFAHAVLGDDQPVRRVYAAGQELTLPGGLRVLSSPGEDEAGGYLLTPSRRDDWSSLVEAPGSGRGGYTRLAFVGADEALSLDEWHARLVEHEAARLGFGGGEEGTAELSRTLSDGTSVDGLRSVLVPVDDGSGGSDAIEVAITSYHRPATGQRAGAMVSTVSGVPKHAELELLTGLALERIGSMNPADRVGTAFGSIGLGGGSAWAEVLGGGDSPDDRRTARVVMGSDELLLTTHRVAPAQREGELDTEHELAARYLDAAWRSAAPEELAGVYPEATEALTAVPVAGTEGLMFEAEAEVDGEPMYLRAVGFLHEGVYTTAVVVQRNGADSVRAERLLGLLRVGD